MSRSRVHSREDAGSRSLLDPLLRMQKLEAEQPETGVMH